MVRRNAERPQADESAPQISHDFLADGFMQHDRVRGGSPWVTEQNSAAAASVASPASATAASGIARVCLSAHHGREGFALEGENVQDLGSGPETGEAAAVGAGQEG